ncbi:related to tRNA isopentenylpyrophosphate transferase [Ustilago trichophora]|uniref:Related to tRNA isopentenylpyrophosphate transferase n=1 Tax=Ustilago trichophora TaxID=86804 RepID=A0A5C3DR25_9BASI|nr:related to tRNA isopentenylpyrophosphate transferase [Ustilago trichophora]
MQIYKGLDIITNKATDEEMSGVKHHLLGFLDPAQSGEKESTYDVTKFVEDTDRIAGELVGEGKVPIVCGGTTYYCQHLLFPGRLITTSGGGGEGEAAEKEVDLGSDPAYQKLSEEEKGLLAQVSTGNSAKMDLATRAANDPELGMQLWKLLNKIDPAMAARWHYKDTRKVGNSLRVFKETGRPHSLWIAEQDAQQQQQQDETQQDNVAGGASGVQGVSNYRKLLLWLWCDPPILRKRLDDRVDEMVRRGLEAEVRQMRNIAKRILDDIVSTSACANYQSGIFQTIGYRQFAEYLDRLEILSTINGITTKQQQQWFDKATEDTKTATRQYAKSQLKWVRNKLIPEVRRLQAASLSSDVELYLLDTSNVEQWEEKVVEPALRVVSTFLNKEKLPDPVEISNPSAVQQYLYSGRTPNQALSKLQNHPTYSDPNGGEGLRTIQANKMFTCKVCTFNPSHPVLVREIDRESHQKARHHRNNIIRKISPQEKELRIKLKIAQGQKLTAQRQQSKHLPKNDDRQQN